MHKIPNASELTARFESNFDFITIAQASVIVGIADSNTATIRLGEY